MFRDNLTGEVVRKALGGDTTFGEWAAENVFKPLAPDGAQEVWMGFEGDNKTVMKPV